MHLVSVTAATDAAEARRRAVALAHTLGFAAPASGNVAIVATELATNLVRHGGGGEIALRAEAGDDPYVELVAIDRGQGMADVAASRRDGHSTDGGAGTGLGAVFRLARHAEIYSLPGVGTAVLAQVGARAAAAASGDLLTGAVCAPKSGETVCGDALAIHRIAAGAAVLVADGLGHGPLAAAASEAARRVFEAAPERSPADALEAMHRALVGSRGAAVAVARVDLAARTLSYCGLGNISGVIIEGNAARHLVSQHGIVGGALPRLRAYDYAFPRGALLVMHSDGLSARWTPAQHPGLFARHPALVAAVLFRDHARRRDDAAVAALRET